MNSTRRRSPLVSDIGPMTDDPADPADAIPPRPTAASVRSNSISTLTIVAAAALLAVVGVVVGLVLFGREMGPAQFRTAAILVVTSLIAFAAPVLTAMLTRPYNIFHPLNFVALSLLFGAFGRVLFILGSDSPVVTELLEGRGPESIIPGGILSMVGSVLFCVGYVIANRLSFRVNWLDGWLSGLNVPRLMILLPVLFAICAAATVLFLKQTGAEFSGIESLSTKRRVVINDVESSLGYYRLIAQDVPRAILLILVAIWATGTRRTTGMMLAIGGFGLLAVALPFLASSRSSVLIAVITVCVVIDRIRTIHLSSLTLAVGVCLVIIFGMLALRRAGTRNVEVSESIVSMGLEPILGNHSFADVTKLAHIYEAVPELIPYKYGSSFISVIFAPVPRSLWPNKPAISMGREITEKVYYRGLDLQDKGGGTPPGLFAESLINFSVYGFPIAVLIAGVLFRVLTNSLGELADHSIAGVAVYGGIVPPFCLSMMGGDFTRSLVLGLSVMGIIAGLCLASRLKILR